MHKKLNFHLLRIKFITSVS